MQLQNRAAITNSSHDSSALFPLSENLVGPTVSEHIESKTLNIVYKPVNRQASTYLTELLLKLLNTCKRELRNTKTDLAVPLRKSAFGQKTFSYKRAKLWNELLVEVKSSKTYEIFKKKYE